MTGPAGTAAVANEPAGSGRDAELVAGEVRAVLAGPDAARAFAAADAARRRGEEPDPRPLYRLLGERRLLAVCWPDAYGGRGLPPRCAAAVVSEMIAAGVPEVLHTLSVQICGNFLLAAGTREQRATVLPGLAAATLACTVLYSEPDAGSDLSTLDTRAEPAGDGGWRITGRKVYSVGTGLADLGLVAARTSEEVSPYQGITLFLVPLDAGGVLVEALPSFADEDFADVRLAGVEVPAGAVVGPVGGAWPLITGALALERTGVDYVAKAELWLRIWRAAATSTAASVAASAAVSATASTAASTATGAAAAPAAGVPVGPPVGKVDADLGRLRTRTGAARALALRCVDQQGTGQADPVLAAATKFWCSETARSVAWWCTENAAPAALWRFGDDAALGHGLLEAAYREAPGLTLSAGTSEMMLELVAGSGLPMPDAGPPPGEEPLAGELRKAVRAIATAYDDRDPPTASWGELARVGMFSFEVPAGPLPGLDPGPDRGPEPGVDHAPGLRLGSHPGLGFGPDPGPGLGLGLGAAVLGCAELGRELHDAGLLDTLTAIDALVAADPAHPARVHLDAAVAGGWRAALVDHRWPDRPLPDPAGAGALLVVLDGPALALVPPDRGGLRICPRQAAAGPVSTVHCGPDLVAPGEVLCSGPPAARVLRNARVRRAAWLSGLALGCLAATVRRSRTREQFGRPLIANQAVAFRLARLTVRHAAVAALVGDLATRGDNSGGGGNGNWGRDSDGNGGGGNGVNGNGGGGYGDAGLAAGALAEAGTLALAASREAVQLHGAFGMTLDSPVRRYYLAAPLAVAADASPAELYAEAGRDER